MITTFKYWLAGKRGTYILGNGLTICFWTSWGHQRFKRQLLLSMYQGNNDIQFEVTEK